MAYDKNDRLNDRDANRDPLTGAPGSHPIGTGVGAAAGGAAAGAAMGTVAGPVGTLIGAAAGAVVGGLAGKAVAERIDPTAEDAYWRDNFRSREYVGERDTYDDFRPAFSYGVASYDTYAGHTFDTAEPKLAAGWEKERGDSKLGWERAKHAVRDSWTRIGNTAERVIPGDSDRDGR